MAFPVAVAADVVDRAEEGGFLSSEHGLDLRLAPDVEAAFLALAVGIQAGRERALPGGHLALEEADGLADARREQLLAGVGPGADQQVEEQRVVVKHLLEVRRQPALVHRIARETAAEMIVDAALGDPPERQEHRVASRRVAGAAVGAPEHLEQHGVGELRGALGPAVHRIDHGEQLPGGLVEHLQRQLGPRSRPGFQPLAQGIPVVLDGLRVRAESLRHGLKDLDEARPPVFRLLREIGAAPDRVPLGGEEHGQRPAALLAGGVQRRHVDLVDVGPFFPIDLDVDEVAVHHAGDVGVLEALVGHHVAPVARGIADRQQDGLAAGLCLRQRGGGPGAPVNGIVGVLQQVGTGLVSKLVVGHPRLARFGSGIGSLGFGPYLEQMRAGVEGIRPNSRGRASPIAPSARCFP